MLAGLALCEMPSQYPRSAFQGFPTGVTKGGSAAVCDPNPPRPFARCRLKKIITKALRDEEQIGNNKYGMQVYGRHQLCTEQDDGYRVGQWSVHISGPEKRHKHKEFGQKPPSQTPRPKPVNSLCLGPPFSSKHRKKPKHKEF